MNQDSKPPTGRRLASFLPAAAGSCHLVFLLALALAPIDAQQPGTLTAGSGVWVRFHHGPSSFQLAPGAAVSLDWIVRPGLEVGVKLLSGALFGNASGGQVRVAYAPAVGAWRPAVGIALQAASGSTVFYHHGGTDYLDPAFPEVTVGLALDPLRLDLGRLGISLLALVIGTDVAHPARILVVDADLFRISVPLGRSSRSRGGTPDPLIGVGGSVSFSLTTVTSELTDAPPLGGELYVRLLDTLEAGLLGTARSQDSFYGSQKSWTVLGAAELRLAPGGRAYRPYAGLGLAYWYAEPYFPSRPVDHLLCAYVSVAPLRFAFRPLFGFVRPTVSVLEIRYGPIFYDGSLPSWTDDGTFLAAVDLVRLGVYLGR